MVGSSGNELELRRRQFEDVFREVWINEPRREDIFNMIRRNALGKMYLIGGYTYRNILNKVYGTPLNWERGLVDVDIVSEEITRKPYVGDWEELRTDFATPRYMKEGYVLDFDVLRNFRGLGVIGPEATIENLLSGAPFDVQALAWDIDKNRLVTDYNYIAIRSIVDRELWVNDLRYVEAMSRRSRLGLMQFFNKKATELGFIANKHSIRSGPRLPISKQSSINRDEMGGIEFMAFLKNNPDYI